MRHLVLLALLLAPAAAQDEDIYKVTPEQLGAGDPGPHFARAQAAYEEKRYEDAARAYLAGLRIARGDATALYNLACCYGLLGAESQAAAFLKAAYNAGFRDLEHVRNDPDFDKVRGSAAFVELMQRMEEAEAARARAAGRTLTVTAPVVADVRVIEPAPTVPGQRYPLVIGLHGLGDQGENFGGLFLNRGLEQPLLFCVPQAPYGFGAGGRVGFSWTLRDLVPARSLLSHELARAYVLAVLAEVKRHYPVDERRVYLMGFSQGAGMAFSVGLRHPDLFAGVIPIGGWLDPGEFTPAQAHRAKETRVLLCHSPEDRVVGFDRAENAEAFLVRHSVPHELVRYEGGHTLPKELLERIVTWIGTDRE